MKYRQFISRSILLFSLTVILLSSCSRLPIIENTPVDTSTEASTRIPDPSTTDTTSPPVPTPQSERSFTIPVYDDTIYEPFIPGTWGEAEYSVEETGRVHTGSHAISIRCGAWEAFELSRRSENWEEIFYLYPNRCKSLTFAFNPGEEIDDDEGLSFSLDLEESIPILDLIEGPVAQDTWYEITVPLSKLNPDAKPMFRLVFFNQSEDESVFFIDDLQLNCTEDLTSPVISYVAVEVGASGKSAVFRFSTNEQTTVEIRYGNESETETVSSPEYRAEHEISLSGLTSGETYEYQILVSDYPGEDGATSNESEATGTFVARPNYGITSFVNFSVDTTQVIGEISPYVYGCNFFEKESFDSTAYTLGRIGGNRWTAYNWENNASNAGSDWYFHNDAYLSASDEPGAAVVERVASIFEKDAAALVTVPIQGYVATDKDGTDVTETDHYLTERFSVNRAFKNGKPGLEPDRSDRYVYQDEFVHFLQNAFPAENRGDHELMYCLDNEPALWSSTHSPIQPEPITYDDLVAKNIEYARAIKSVAPEAMIFGFVGYGYNAFVNLQDAPDSNRYGAFIDYYLTRLSEAESEYGKRLVDVLDIHWYPEAQDEEGNRITAESGEEGIARARIQAPRSLWDPAYTEKSWITDTIGGPIALIPWLTEKIDRLYPGTELAITEYYFGGSDHISGAIAQADFLGIAGREGVYAACLWPMTDIGGSYIESAFDMYLNYDGRGSHFGDTSVIATTTDIEATSVYASIDSTDPDRLVIMAINKTDGWTEALVNMHTDNGMYTSADVYVLSGIFATPEQLDSFRINAEIFAVDLSPMSVTCIILSR